MTPTGRIAIYRGHASVDSAVFTGIPLQFMVHRLASAALLALVGLVLLAPPAAAEQQVRLLAFGDSLVHGYGLHQGDTFPEQLEVALRERGYPVTVINGGNSGDTTAAGRARLDWALADRPDIVLVELGGNDMLRGIDPVETRRNLDHILARLKAEGLPVLFAGMRAPANMGPAYIEAYDSIFPELAEKHDVAFYPFFLDGVALERDLNLPDGLHPNAAGVAVIVERILPSVEALIRPLLAARNS